MRILHVSDLHIGIKLGNYDLLEDQSYAFDQIYNYIKEKQVEVLIIAGDVFDKSNPSSEALKQYNDFIKGVYKAKEDIKIMVISGNHDSAQRIDSYRDLLFRQEFYTVGIAPETPDSYIEQVTLKDKYGDIHFYLLPFVRPSMVRETLEVGENESLSYDKAIHMLIDRENINTNDRNVFVSHQFYLPLNEDIDEVERSDSEVSTVGNIDVVYADCLDAFDYVALGHIHKPMTVGKQCIRYSGTPMPYSLSERNQTKQVLLIDLEEKNNITITSLPIKPLRDVGIITGLYEDLIKQTSDNYVRVELTDKEDLDVLDMQERLRSCYPHLLEIVRTNVHSIDYSQDVDAGKLLNPYELICEFMPEMDDESKKIIQDIINESKGA